MLSGLSSYTLLYRFEETPEGLDIDIGTGDKEEASSHKFSNGDNVEVVEGELQNLQGRVIAVDGTKITILPKHEDLKDPLDFQAKELRKYFRQVSPPLKELGHQMDWDIFDMYGKM